MSKNKLLVVFFVAFILFDILAVWLILNPQKLEQIKQNLGFQPRVVLEEPVKVEKSVFPDLDLGVDWLAVEFTSEPWEQISYKAEASVVGDPNKLSFNVVLGAPDGNVRSGICDYDVANGDFSGNATWVLQDTPSFIQSVHRGTQAVLRFYFPEDISPGDESYKLKRQLLDELIEDVNQGGPLRREYLIAPDEICLIQD